MRAMGNYCRKMDTPMRTKRAEMHLSLGLDETTLATFCQAHRICKLSLFGTQLKGSALVDSGVGLLVEFEPNHIPNLFELTRMEAEISDLIGKKVDLRTAGSIFRCGSGEAHASSLGRISARHQPVSST
jgi:predicted nucleotidyltransferase